MNKLEEYGINQRYLTESKMYPEYVIGRVINQNKGIYKVVTEEREVFAEISGKFRYETEELVKYPAVGDFVMLDLLDENSNSIIHQVLTRKSIFSRTSVGTKGQEQVIATNIDIVFICMSLNNNYNLSRLERYLSIAWDSRAKPVIILTKSDLCDNIENIVAEVERVSMYSDILVTSIYEDNVQGKIGKYLEKGITAAFVGSSGVGKSSIINKIITDNTMEVKEIGIGDKGKHTTTGRYILKTIFGGVVIDTPGMREIGVVSADVNTTFADIDELALNCKYSDCTHEGEPDCAVQKAIMEGIIDKRRLDNYNKIKNENSYEGLSAKEIEVKKHERMFSEVGGLKNARKFIRNNQKNKKGNNY